MVYNMDSRLYSAIFQGLSIADGPSMGGLEAFVIDSNEALKFRLLKRPSDVDTPESDDDFEPEMTHQIYGDK